MSTVIYVTNVKLYKKENWLSKENSRIIMNILVSFRLGLEYISTSIQIDLVFLHYFFFTVKAGASVKTTLLRQYDVYL